MNPFKVLHNTINLKNGIKDIRGGFSDSHKRPLFKKILGAMSRGALSDFEYGDKLPEAFKHITPRIQQLMGLGQDAPNMA